VSRSALIWIAISIATIGTVAGVGYLLQRSGMLGASASGEAVAVAPDDHYLVFLSLLEIESRTPSGGAWDARDSAPDVRYEIHWRGSRVFRSSVRSDTFVARWDPEELGIRDLLQGVSSERSLKAARITATQGETIEFRVIDEDPMANDAIGRWEVPVASLKTGDQTWNRPAPGIRQAVCRVLGAARSGR
jgi:hypothetical protein